jgi:hypothetical protein
MALAVMRARDRWEDVWRSLQQLVLGSYMVWDARRHRLCQRHFDGSSGLAGDACVGGGQPGRLRGCFRVVRAP